MQGQTFIPSIKEKCRQVLSHPWATPVILILTIAGRAIQQIYFFNTRSDMSYQVLAAEHLLNGHGISYAGIAAADISTINYEPLNNWPPGFSLLFAPFYLLFGKNYIIAGIALGIAAAVLLLFLMRGIARLLDVPKHLVNLFTLLAGFFGYYFYTMPCTDAVAITCFAAAFYFIISIIKKKGRFSLQLAGLIISLLFCGFIKYLYVLPVFVLPLYLLIYGSVNKDSLLKKAGQISFVTLLLTFGLFLLIQQRHTGSVGFIKEAERGFYPENLRATFPFVTAAFSRPDTAEYVTGKTETLYQVFQAITVIVSAILLFFFFKNLLRGRLRNLSITQNFLQLSFCVSACIIGLLILLSLRVGKETFDFGKWTYVQEPRYYGFIIILIQLAALVLYANRKVNYFNAGRLLFPLLFLLMTAEVVRGVTFTGSRIIKFNKEKYGWQQELQLQQAADKIVKRIQRQNPSMPVVLAGQGDWMMLRVSLYSHIPFFTAVEKLETRGTIITTKSIILLLMVKEEEITGFKSFISLSDVNDEGLANGFHFYSKMFTP